MDKILNKLDKKMKSDKKEEGKQLKHIKKEDHKQDKLADKGRKAMKKGKC